MSESTVLEYFRSNFFRDFLNEYTHFGETSSALRSYPELFEPFEQFKTRINGFTPPPFEKLGSMMSQKYGVAWENVSISALPFLTLGAESFLRNNDITSLGRLSSEGDRLLKAGQDEEIVKRSLWFLAEPNTPVGDDYMQQFISPSHVSHTNNHHPGTAPASHMPVEELDKPFPFNPSPDYHNLLRVIREVVNRKDPDCLDAVFDILSSIDTLDTISRVAVWPDGLAVLDKNNAIHFFPIWDLCADLPIFTRHFVIELKELQSSASDFIDTCMPDTYNSAKFSPVPKDDHALIINQLISYIKTSNNYVPKNGREASSWMKRFGDGKYHYWKGVFVGGRRKQFIVFSWKLLPEILHFCGWNVVEIHMSELCKEPGKYLYLKLAKTLKKYTDAKLIGDLIQKSEDELDQTLKSKLSRNSYKKLKKDLNDVFGSDKAVGELGFTLNVNLIYLLFDGNLSSPIWPLLNRQISMGAGCHHCLLNLANNKTNATPYCELREITIQNEFEWFCAGFIPYYSPYNREMKSTFRRIPFGPVFRIKPGGLYGFEPVSI